MVTKVRSAALAASSGIPVLVTAAAHLSEVLDPSADDGGPPGTVFAPTGRRLTARRLWLGYAAEARGRLRVDAGAARAVTAGKKSLLAVGVVGVDGEFGAGEPVEIADPDGRIIARGLAAYSSREMARVAGMSLEAIGAVLGADRAVEAVHRDELVTHARARRPAP
jgi:glutamate 5-kinase